MITNKTAVPSTLDLLMGAYRAHVHRRALPTPVLVAFHHREAQVEVQLGGGPELPFVLADVLLWATTLAEVTAEWTHAPSGLLLVTVRGRAASGVRFLAYGGGSFADCFGLVQLQAGEREGVSLDELYALLHLIREREAA